MSSCLVVVLVVVGQNAVFGQNWANAQLVRIAEPYIGGQSLPEFDDDDKTIFSGDLDPEEKVAVEKGEARGKRVAMAEDPERFGMARQKALGRENYSRNYDKIDWSVK